MVRLAKAKGLNMIAAPTDYHSAEFVDLVKVKAQKYECNNDSGARFEMCSWEL